MMIISSKDIDFVTDEIKININDFLDDSQSFNELNLPQPIGQSETEKNDKNTDSVEDMNADNFIYQMKSLIDESKNFQKIY